MTETVPTPDPDPARPRRAGGRAFAWSIAVAVAGAVAFMVGLDSAFSRYDHEWEDLIPVGIALLVAAGLGNLVATGQGLSFLLRERSLPWWWPFSLIGTAGSLWAGWVVLHL